MREVIANIFMLSNITLHSWPIIMVAPSKRIFPRQGAMLQQMMMHSWTEVNMWAVKHLLEIEIFSHGLENIPEGATFLTLSDHHGVGEIVSLFKELGPWNPRYTAKAQVFKIPMLGWGISAMGYIPFRRGSEQAVHNWVVEIAQAFYGKSWLFDALVGKLSGISFEEWIRKLKGDQVENAVRRDLDTVHRAIDNLKREGLSFNLINFVTGTRRTDKKFLKSLEIEGEKGYPRFNFTLVPKFGATTQLLNDTYDMIDGVVLVNVGYTYEDGTRHLRDSTKKFRTFMRGDFSRIDFYFEWIPKEDLPKPQEDYYEVVKRWILSDIIWPSVDARLGNWIETGSFTSKGSNGHNKSDWLSAKPQDRQPEARENSSVLEARDDK